MGASQYKKKRVEERQAGPTAKEMALQEEQKQKKRSRIRYTLVGIVVLLCVALVIFVNSSLFTDLTAVKIGDTSYSIAQARYAYQTAYSNFYSNYSSYISYFLDTSKPLDEQTCAFDSTRTWEEYFLDEGLNYLQEMTLLYDAAVEEGYELSEEDLAAIDSTIDSLGLYASMYGYTTEAYISAYYGEGNTEESVRDMLSRTQLAYRYADDKQSGYSYTGEEKDAYYDENANTYNTVSYLRATLTAAADEGDGTGAEEALTALRESAEAILAACDGSVESFRDAVLAETGSEATEMTSYWTSLGDNYDWFTDPTRSAGDSFSEELENSVNLYCFQAAETNDYPLVSVRHILIKAVDEDEDGEYGEEELAAAREAILAVEEEWDGTEEDFIRLAEEYSEDTGSNTNGGLYENIYKGQMVEEFNDFCFGERKPGDTAVVYGSSSSYAGYHLIYFVGENELYSRYIADSALRSSDFYQWENTLKEAYPIAKSFSFRYV